MTGFLSQVTGFLSQVEAEIPRRYWCFWGLKRVYNKRLVFYLKRTTTAALFLSKKLDRGTDPIKAMIFDGFFLTGRLKNPLEKAKNQGLAGFAIITVPSASRVCQGKGG